MSYYAKISFTDNANGNYFAGQKMSGKVELNLSEAIECRSFCVSFHGTAGCEWRELGFFRNTTYKGQLQYLSDKIYLFGRKNGEPKRIRAGVHTYRFSRFLPSELPYSVDVKHGSICYSVKSILDIPWKLDVCTFKRFTICENLDLNLYPDLKMPCEEEYVSKLCCLLRSKPVFLEASIPYSGYTCGDTINVAIKVINNSNETVPGVKIELLRRIKYSFRGDDFNVKYASDVMEKVYAQAVENNTAANFMKELVVPSNLANTNDFFYSIVQISYEIKVTCMTEGWRISPKVHIPITLGTFPLSSDVVFQQMY